MSEQEGPKVVGEKCQVDHGISWCCYCVSMHMTDASVVDENYKTRLDVRKCLGLGHRMEAEHHKGSLNFCKHFKSTDSPSMWSTTGSI